MIGETSYKPYAIRTVNKFGLSFDEFAPAHYVHPHWVSSYTRSDGTHVSGYWRDGDGDTSINRAFGYFAKNPGAAFSIFTEL